MAENWECLVEKLFLAGKICSKCVSRLGTEIMREIQTFTAEDIKDFIAVDTSGSPLLLKYRANIRLIETEGNALNPGIRKLQA